MLYNIDELTLFDVPGNWETCNFNPGQLCSKSCIIGFFCNANYKILSFKAGHFLDIFSPKPSTLWKPTLSSWVLRAYTTGLRAGEMTLCSTLKRAEVKGNLLPARWWQILQQYLCGKREWGWDGSCGYLRPSLLLQQNLASALS